MRYITMLILAALAGCATPPCKPPEAVHLMVDDKGNYIIPDDVARIRDGVCR